MSRKGQLTKIFGIQRLSRSSSLILRTSLFDQFEPYLLLQHTKFVELLSVKQCPVGTLSMGTDVLVGQLIDLHVEVGCFLAVLESNVQKGLLQFLLDGSQCKAEVFIVRTASQEKDLQHA